MWVSEHLVRVNSLIAFVNPILPEALLFPCFTLQNPYLYSRHGRVEMEMNMSTFGIINNDPPPVEVKCGLRDGPVNGQE